ncbi:MAG TPA: YafY family protein [Sphingobacterium sp.]|nr:YafY family protein [Sphingobacterium sp.]
MTDIQKRFDRILAIFMYLQAKPLVTAGELADKYGVSLRTVYRDIRSLIAAGVPIYGEAGSGYALVQGYKLPPLQFTKEEALSFVAAEKLINKYADKQLSGSFNTGLHKIKAILRSAEKQDVEFADDKLLVRGPDQFVNANVQDGLSILIDSVVSKKCVQIHYLKPSETEIEVRRIEPIGVFVDNNFWYVMAYCHLRKDVRQFRLDRIQLIILLDESFVNEYKELAYYLEKKADLPKTNVVFSVDKRIGRYLHWERQYYGFVREEMRDDRVMMYFETDTSLESFARWCLMFADLVEIIEPLALKEKIYELLRESLRKMS